MGNSKEESSLPEKETQMPHKLTRSDVINILKEGGNLEGLILADLDLAGLDFEGKSFRGSDIRGMSLYREEQSEDGGHVEITTNIKGADFTDAIIADLGWGTVFRGVDAEGATFGYTEDLPSRRKRFRESGEGMEAKDTSGLFRFNAGEGNFRETKWVNVDFGGGTGFESIFFGADLRGAIIEGCDLSAMDFSETAINDIAIIDPVSLEGMRINEKQIESVAQAIELTDRKKQEEFEALINDKSQRKALEKNFGMIIVEIKGPNST